jgi:hypothetical protein
MYKLKLTPLPEEGWYKTGYETEFFTVEAFKKDVEGMLKTTFFTYAGASEELDLFLFFMDDRYYRADRDLRVMPIDAFLGKAEIVEAGV